jgi:hypothetical protein
LDEPPTADDIRRLWALAGCAPGGDAALLALLRNTASIREVIAQLTCPDRTDDIGALFLADVRS